MQERRSHDDLKSQPLLCKKVLYTYWQKFITTAHCNEPATRKQDVASTGLALLLCSL